MTSAYFLAETIQYINMKNCMTTSESKGRFFLLNESIRIDSHNESNRIDSNRKLECSNQHSMEWHSPRFAAIRPVRSLI